jgi:hypothetical protein
MLYLLGSILFLVLLALLWLVVFVPIRTEDSQAHVAAHVPERHDDRDQYPTSHHSNWRH